MNLSLLCTGTLHIKVGRRTTIGGKTALESVYDTTTAQQVLHRRHRRVTFRRLASLHVGPFGRNHRPTSVRQRHDQIEPSPLIPVPKHRQGLSLQWMGGPGDLYKICEVVEMGSLCGGP